MDVKDYFQALRRFWWAFLACLLIGVVGAAGYNRGTYLDEARASVAVLSPVVSTKASGSTEAQVSFDAIIKSNTLASLVAARLNESTKDITDNLSVSIDTGSGSGSSTASTGSPLYLVHGKDHGLQRAEMMVNIAVEEASTLYVKINATDGSDMKAALSSQRAEIAGELTAAQSALDKYSSDNNAADLPSHLQQQRSKVDQLSVEVYSAEALAQADLHSYYPQSALYSRDQNAYLTLARELAKEQAELKRLNSLFPKYQDLQFEVLAAEGRETAFDAQSQSLLVNTLLPAQVQIKVLDPAAEESQLLFLLLTYGLGAAAGIILGMGAIYVLGMVYRRPATVEEVAAAVGGPILVRIPRVVGGSRP